MCDREAMTDALDRTGSSSAPARPIGQVASCALKDKVASIGLEVVRSCAKNKC